MRFEIRYPSGSQDEVELSGSVVVVGRDPGCDLVLDDHKCSRRHAVLEASPGGVSIRDSGSANGVFVNGRKVDQAELAEGDLVQLGEVFLKVLPEEYPSTIVMADAPDLDGPPPEPDIHPEPVTAQDLPLRPPPPPPPLRPMPAAPPPQPTAKAVTLERVSGPLPRPLALSLLAALQFFGAVLTGAGGVALALLWRDAPVPRGAIVTLALLIMAAGIATGIGLWMRAGWARMLQIACGALSVFTCAFLPLGVAVIWYMFRNETRLQFSGRADLRLFSAADAQALREDRLDTAFTGAIAGGLLLGLVLAALVAFLVLGPLGPFRPPTGTP